MRNTTSRFTRLVDVPIPRLNSATTPVAAAGIVLVIYGDLFALWLGRHDAAESATAQKLLAVVRTWLNTPLGISADFGTLGVCLLLTAAGYSITEATATHGLRVVGGLGWILPMLCCAVTVSIILLTLDGQTLAPLVWPIVVGLLFGGLLLATYNLLPGLPWLAVAMQLGAIAVGVGTCASVIETTSVDVTGELGKVMAFAAMPVIGELAWLSREGRLTGSLACGYGAAAVGIPVLTEAYEPTLAPWWHPVTALFATLVGVLGLRFVRNREFPLPVKWLADRSLAILLVTGTLGYATLNATGTWMPFPVAAFTALIVVLVSGELLQRSTMLLYRAVRARGPVRSRRHAPPEPR